jgi:hypothetical protein
MSFVVGKLYKPKTFIVVDNIDGSGRKELSSKDIIMCIKNYMMVGKTIYNGDSIVIGTFLHKTTLYKMVIHVDNIPMYLTEIL